MIKKLRTPQFRANLPGVNSPFPRVLIAIACGGLFGRPSISHGERHPTSESKSLNEIVEMGAPVSGAPIFTPNMPFGIVTLTAVLKSGTTSGDIAILFNAYSEGAGTFGVSAVTASSGRNVVLGTLTVATMQPTYYTDPLRGTVEIPGGLGTADFGGKGTPLPVGFNLFDIASISLSDSNGNIVKTGILTPVQVASYTAISPLVPGATAPRARGFALFHDNTIGYAEPLSAPASGGAVALTGTLSISGSLSTIIPYIPEPPLGGHMIIHAHGLPRHALLTYAIDGTDLHTVTTDDAGNLILFAEQTEWWTGIRKIPSTVNLFSVKTVTVHDSAGRVLVSASF
jgi:hypothetical protein